MDHYATHEIKWGTATRKTAQGVGSALHSITRSFVKSLLRKSHRTGRAAFGKKGRICLGASVWHCTYGNGHVLAHWPDGRLLIAFDRMADNQLIFPSMLSCTQL